MVSIKPHELAPFQGKDYWLRENLRFSQVHFRMEKCARIVNELCANRECDLLDLGCGTATLGALLDNNVHYFGLDIAIHDPKPNLLELDLATNEIKFGDKTFDIVVAEGLFEYLGGLQRNKFEEIQRLLKERGKFVVSYLNFEHINDRLCDDSRYSNIQTIHDFKKDLELYFRVDRWFTSAVNWHRSEPRRNFLRKIEMPLRVNIPLLSRALAVEYFFVCSLKK